MSVVSPQEALPRSTLCYRDEIPYLLDLHLFLSRPLSVAPVRAIGEAAEAVMDPSVSLLGAFPQVRGWAGVGKLHARQLEVARIDLIF